MTVPHVGPDGADGWEVDRSTSSAADFHARPVADPARREIRVHGVTGRALVMGSTQRDDVVDHAACRALGAEVVRRRSGGGAVHLDVGAQTWVDVIVPRGAPGWHDDVHRPMRWLGEHLVGALDAVGIVARAHDGPMERTAHSDLVCFDGLAPGEVVVGDAKLMGISQRRTRAAARLQCCWYHRHDHRDLVALLATTIDVTALRPVAVVDADRSATVVDELILRLSRAR